MISELFYNLSQSVLFAILVAAFFKLSLYLRLRKIHGRYLGEDIDGNEFKNKKYEVIFNLKNLFLLRNKLTIKQYSEEKGNWVSTFNVPENNPLFLNGSYKYTSKYDEWGLHEIQINPEEGEIFVKTKSRNKRNEVEYLLKKQN